MPSCSLVVAVLDRRHIASLSVGTENGDIAHINSCGSSELEAYPVVPKHACALSRIKCDSTLVDHRYLSVGFAGGDFAAQFGNDRDGRGVGIYDICTTDVALEVVVLVLTSGKNSLTNVTLVVIVGVSARFKNCVTTVITDVVGVGGRVGVCALRLTTSIVADMVLILVLVAKGGNLDSRLKHIRCVLTAIGKVRVANRTAPIFYGTGGSTSSCNCCVVCQSMTGCGDLYLGYDIVAAGAS